MKEDTNMTLRQGLEKFHRENEEYLSHEKEGVSPEAKAFFKSHDAAHVLFGCDISLFGEGAVKIWTIFGTTLGFWKHFKGYQDANAYELSKEFNFIHVLKHIFKFLFSIPILIFRAKRMNKPWPWTGFDSYLDMPIADIRKEFNIQVL